MTGFWEREQEGRPEGVAHDNLERFDWEQRCREQAFSDDYPDDGLEPMERMSLNNDPGGDW